MHIISTISEYIYISYQLIKDHNNDLDNDTMFLKDCLWDRTPFISYENLANYCCYIRICVILVHVITKHDKKCEKRMQWNPSGVSLFGRAATRDHVTPEFIFGTQRARTSSAALAPPPASPSNARLLWETKLNLDVTMPNLDSCFYNLLLITTKKQFHEMTSRYIFI